MTIHRIKFTSRQLAESMLGDPNTAVISIGSPGVPEAQLAPTFISVLRLSFFDAVPADPYMPSRPGLFDGHMARQVIDYIGKLHATEMDFTLLVHCELGVSRSAAVALFAEAYSGAPLDAREFTFDANPWVIEQLEAQSPPVVVAIPPKEAAHDRRRATR